MSDRIKGVVFNMLGDISNLTVLDAYAGSGALGLECLSRGAQSVQFVEKAKNAYDCLLENITHLGVQNKAIITLANIKSWSQNNENILFDLVLADPPFNRLNIEHLEQLTKHLKNSSTMVISYSGRRSTPTVNGVVVVDNRSYGNAALAFYRLDS
jgi:16S rRNA (guanine966-N2)-methyltransferase